MLTTLVTRAALKAAMQYAMLGEYVLVGDCIRFAASYAPECFWRFVDTLPRGIPSSSRSQDYLIDCLDSLADEL